ncbi:hypothetical protein [Mammaliicoccus sciuri]|uniref:hypothetical protein n=1 Tax=Mammaliicoccus sciuri TaxID=1296 RepID=UPI002B25BCAC|nr:hypothetical protein [Mammaliicoccus sciuri]WQL16948.1 hypothetical protein P3U34_11190 [Mammaliicoccus sciuri]
MKHKINDVEYNVLKRTNKPMVHITMTQGKYKYLEVDFITCDWCISKVGQAKLQARLNMESTFMWLRGYNIKTNYNSVGNMTIQLRGDDIIIGYLINELNKLLEDSTCWMKYRNKNRMLNIDRHDHKLYVRPIRHHKSNTNILV